MWKLCPGQFQLTFSAVQIRKLLHLWWFLSQILRIMIKHWSNDVCGFKMICWPKIWTFDCQMTILPLQLTVVQLGFWLCNFVLNALKLDMRMLDHICRHVRLYWALGNFIFLIRTKTLILTVQEALTLCNPWGILELDLAISWRIWEGKFWGTTVAPVQSS